MELRLNKNGAAAGETEQVTAPDSAERVRSKKISVSDSHEPAHNVVLGTVVKVMALFPGSSPNVIRTLVKMLLKDNEKKSRKE